MDKIKKIIKKIESTHKIKIDYRVDDAYLPKGWVWQANLLHGICRQSDSTIEPEILKQFDDDFYSRISLGIASCNIPNCEYCDNTI